MKCVTVLPVIAHAEAVGFSRLAHLGLAIAGTFKTGSALPMKPRGKALKDSENKRKCSEVAVKAVETQGTAVNGGRRSDSNQEEERESA